MRIMTVLAAQRHQLKRMRSILVKALVLSRTGDVHRGLIDSIAVGTKESCGQTIQDVHWRGGDRRRLFTVRRNGPVRCCVEEIPTLLSGSTGM